ncbi:hypothetical protein DRE_06790 [Drechslerella stenobrocha 248]|uniref:Uncharacterized protein n=1 Tax=Drechslerella stenobrocha 248 TaxID=1043628 RepID=W7HWG8_9PEZI|nr:hypothetical protein DRE_06790 [Drechslerella stenobrocha 248]
MPTGSMIPSKSSTSQPLVQNGTPAVTGAPEDPEAAEESSLLSALTLLHQMHQKLTLLRESIPHMVQPIMKAGSYSTSEALFEDFSKRTLKASEDLVEFTTLVSDEKWVFEKASTSRKDGAENGEVRRWKSSAPVPVYLKEALADAAARGKTNLKEEEEEREKKRAAAAAGKEREVPIEEVLEMEGEEARERIVEEFRTEHGDIEITPDDDGKIIKIGLPKALNLTFSIEFPDISSESNRYVVTLPVSSYLHMLILRSVTTRPNSGSLKYLLDMLATYKTIYTTKCSKCGKLTNGPKADLPVVRRLKKTIKLVRKDKVDDSENVDRMDTSADGQPAGLTKEDKGKAGKPRDSLLDEKSGEDAKQSADEDAEIELIEEHWASYHEGCLA